MEKKSGLYNSYTFININFIFIFFLYVCFYIYMEEKGIINKLYIYIYQLK